jgi:hypothetical protein
VLTGAVALFLAVGGAIGGTAGPVVSHVVAGPPQPDLPSSSGLSITMTVVNDGHPVSLLDQTHPGWANTGIGNAEKVTVTVHLAGASVHQWQSHLEAPDAFQGLVLQDCRGDEEVPPQEISCVFPVSAAAGPNLLHFTFTADNGRVVADASGYLMGGELGWRAGWEVLDATGQWSEITRDQVIELPATMSSSLRYVVINSGSTPFRVTNGCDHKELLAGAQLICPVRGVRPVQSLAGAYQQRLRIEDAVGGTAAADLDTTIHAFTGIFTLDRTSVVVGQPVRVRATGLPTGADFALEYRLDQEPVLVGTTTTQNGNALLTFPVPGTSPGTVHVQIEHDGLAVASLPVDVTLVPRPPDAAAPAWPWLLLLLVPVAGAILLLRRRAVRARASRERLDPGPYPDASPARREPAVAHRS